MQGSEVRTDIPAHNIYRDGRLDEQEARQVTQEWTDHHVGSLLGCLFTFETAQAAAGLRPRNMAEDKAPPVYTTYIPLNPSGIFTGSYVVVSLR